MSVIVKSPDGNTLIMTNEEYSKYCDEIEAKKRERENDKFKQQSKSMYFNRKNQILSYGNTHLIDCFNSTH